MSLYEEYINNISDENEKILNEIKDEIIKQGFSIVNGGSIFVKIINNTDLMLDKLKDEGLIIHKMRRKWYKQLSNPLEKLNDELFIVLEEIKFDINSSHYHKKFNLKNIELL